MPKRNLYKQKIIDHYKSPRNFGEMKDADMEAHIANTMCGDEMTVYLDIVDGEIKEMKFKGTGCAISLAAASMMTEEVVGKHVSEVMELEEKFVLDMMGMDAGSARVKCATLVLEALRRAIKMEEDDPCDFC